MKLRIKDSSFRFRITLMELKTLRSSGKLACRGDIPSTGGEPAAFSYSVVVDPGAGQSELRLEPFAITLVLSAEDCRQLAEPTREGVYIQREWTDPDGQVHRTMAFIEKDRPGSSCDKPEEWIYEDWNEGDQPKTRPIPK